MALDSQEKRWRAQAGMPWSAPPIPDGTVSLEDRAQLAGVVLPEGTFPILSTGQRIEGFRDEHSDDAVRIADPKDGYPFVNKIFDFDPRDFYYMLRHVSQADKLTVMAFYQNYKTRAFPWLNEQENALYEVVFIKRPTCSLDDEKDEWMIGVNLRQAS